MNVASYLTAWAGKAPARTALIYPKGYSSGQVVYGEMTFQQLNEESDRYAHGLAGMGMGRGCKVLLMVPPGVEFIILTFALFKIGAVVILIDPGMGRDNLLHCIDEVEPEGLIAVPLVHAVSALYREPFRHVRHRVTVGRRWFWGGAALGRIRQKAWQAFPPADVAPEDPAAIVFTTGSTGIPKGVLYLHSMFDAQIRSIRTEFDIKGDDVGLPAFPPFALFCAAMGTTCVLPHMDPTKPAEVNPREVVGPIQHFGVTYSFGSPAFWYRVGRYCAEQGVGLPSLKKIIMAGAPVAEVVLRQLKEVLPEDGESYTPYGATEALPLTSISGSEVLRETIELSRRGGGICVGRKLPGVELRIIRISEEPVPEWNDALVLPPGEIGEIVVKGDVVTREYYKRKDQTALAKISQGSAVWHRMGDVGYLDGRGRLWFCGRKSHRVIAVSKTHFTDQCEAIFNQHPDVFRSALVGIGPRTSQRPIMIIEPKTGKMPAGREEEKRFAQELLEIGRRSELTRDLREILFHPSFPVDYRHNAKILRERLALWAEERMK